MSDKTAARKLLQGQQKCAFSNPQFPRRAQGGEGSAVRGWQERYAAGVGLFSRKKSIDCCPEGNLRAPSEAKVARSVAREEAT